MNEPIPFIGTLVVIAMVVAVSWWYRRRWLAKHAADVKPPAAMIAAVSPGTGELIPTGAEEISDRGLGDGLPPESPYT